MTDEKFLGKAMSDKELDDVTGGTIAETVADGFKLYRRGLVEDVYVGSERTRNAINALGYKYGDKGGLFKANEYFDRAGNPTDRGKFWKDFDKQYQTEPVPVVDVICEQLAKHTENTLADKKILCPV